MSNENFDTFKKCNCSKEFNNGYINIQRFIDKLDEYFSYNDLEGAKKHLEYFENEATINNDIKALMTILNEELGFSRRTDDKLLADNATTKIEELFCDDRFSTPSYATIMVNMATTLSCFDNVDRAFYFYNKAKEIYKKYNLLESYEYASLLNNESTTYSKINKFDDAINNINDAITILKKDNEHDIEIAVSLVNLAHITFDKDQNSYIEVEQILDKAWEYINSENQKHDQNYAFQLSKIAPSFRYFQREVEAYALEEVVKEIYGDNKL